MSKKRVAILLATYNGESFISKQIRSILDQVGVEVHIFVSDDSSIDNTLNIVYGYISSYRNISLIGDPGHFGSASANFFELIRSVDLDDFDFVAFSDQDDIWFKDKLITAIIEMSDSNSCGYSSDVIAYWPNTGKRQLVKKSYRETKMDFWFEAPGPGCSQVFTQDSFVLFQTLVRNNGTELKRIDYHDWLIYAFYRYNGLKWTISSNPKMLYTQHANNQIGVNSGLAALRKRIYLIRNKWFRCQVEEISKLVSGKSTSILSFPILSKNVFGIRRRIHHSFILYVLFVCRIL